MLAERKFVRWDGGERSKSSKLNGWQGERVNRRFAIVLVTVLCFGAGVLAYVFHLRFAASAEFQHQVKLGREEAAWIREHVIVPTKKRLLARDNFTSALEKFGLSHQDAARASAAAQQEFNLRQVRAGNTITVGRSVEGDLREIDYKIDPDRMLKIVPADSGFKAEVREIPSKFEVTEVSGKLDDSLFNAVEQAGESPEIALRLSQIFGYDLDFYTDPRKGDTFRVLLEKKKYANGQMAGYGKIFAAEYDNGGKKYQALLFHDEFGRAAYYTADGKSLQKEFLRSPLKFGAPVTSHFSNARFHPILKIVRPHLGTDYGAPVGTPVQTIGSGRVLFAGQKGRRREHGANRPFERLRNHVSAFVPHVRPGGAARRNRKDHRPRWQHRAFHGATSRFSNFAEGPVQELREARLATFRSRFEKTLAGICGRSGEMAAAPEKT